MQLTSASSLLAPFGWEQRFEMLERVGSGAMGQVWRAREVATDKVVALKLLDSSRVGDEQTLARLEVEGETLTKLREAGAHEHVVPIHDFRITAAHACLVTEFIPGLDLRRWCSTNRLGLQDRIKLIAQVARAAGWFHALGVVHRDLKPVNILVNAITHQPIIVDFSIAKVKDTLTLTMTNEALGTVPYMAPEQIACTPGQISPATDVYALGATLYELLTQIPPHPGEFSQVVRRHLEQVAPARPSVLNREISSDLDSVLLKCLSHAPGDRYADGVALADDLDRFLAGQPVRARPISTITHVIRQVRRRPGLALASVSCLFLASTLAWGWHRTQAQQKIREIELGIVILKDEKSWGRTQFRAVDRMLVELARVQPARADALAEEIAADVVQDVNDSITRAFSKPEECRWINEDVIDWLRPKEPVFANALKRRVEGRLNDWRVKCLIRGPFTDLAGLFPDGGMRAGPELLMLERDHAPIKPVVVTRSIQVPFEVSITLVPQTARFAPLLLSLKLGGHSLGARVEQGWSAPEEVIRLIEDPAPLDPEDYVLSSMRDGVPQAAQVMRKITNLNRSMIGQSFAINVRWEEGRVAARVSGMRVVEAAGVVFSSASAKPVCELNMPPDLGIREMTVRVQVDNALSEKTLADRHIAEKRWSSAEGVLSRRAALLDDDETLCKLALCQWWLGRNSQAIAAWRMLANKSGPWAAHSAFRLWYHRALDSGIDSATEELQRIPGDGELVPATSTPDIALAERGQMADLYCLAASRSDGIHLAPERARDALKVLRILGFSPHVQAARLALPLHHHGLDILALRLLHVSLDKTAGPYRSPVSPELLDHWCRIQRCEDVPELRALLERHRQSSLPSLMSIWAWQEHGREFARGGHLAEALQVIQAHGTQSKLSSAAFASESLLHGMLLHCMDRSKEADAVWRAALDSGHGGMVPELGLLFDQSMLRTATRTWDREAVVGLLLPGFDTPRLGRSSASALHAALANFLTNGQVLQALNRLADNPAVIALVQDGAFRAFSARELSHRWTLLVLEQCLLETSFQGTVSAQARGRIQDTLACLVRLPVIDSHDDEAFLRFLRQWVELPESPELIDFNTQAAPLETRLRWLLARRYRSLGNVQAASVLEASLKKEPVFPQDWLKE